MTHGALFDAATDTSLLMGSDERVVTLTAGRAVQVEIGTGGRRVIEFLLEPLWATTRQAIRER